MIATHNLSYTYVGASHPAADGVSFSVARGEVFSFLGPSRAGKSTTQKTLTGLLKRYRGEVTVLARWTRRMRAR